MPAATAESYFYYGTTRKIVTVFGAFFNDIYTGRKLEDGTLANLARVPLSYGPRSKFLARINELKASDSIAIKLPRMAFELVGMSLDNNSKVNPLNRRKFCTAAETGTANAAFAAVPYILTFSLDIFGRTQDDVLQILEQIIPIFTPDYTVAIKDMEGPGTLSQIPFTLTDISLSDEYAGDFEPARPIVYTLGFSVKVKYLGAITRNYIIERAMVNFRDSDTSNFLGEKQVAVQNDDTPISYVSNVNPDQSYEIEFNDDVDYVIGENIIGASSGYAGLILEVKSTSVVIKRRENFLIPGEILIGQVSRESKAFTSITLYENES